LGVLIVQLLVSVRSAAEAEAALAGGAGLIDVKEPRRGPLGPADEDVIRAVVRTVQGRLPVSAALGELRESPATPVPDGLAFVKWGLAGLADQDWRGAFCQRAQPFLASGGPTPVLVAYADAQPAGAPPVNEVTAFACQGSWAGKRILLIDTFDKAAAAGRRNTLLDWLTIDQVGELCRMCRTKGVRVALAGSLGVEQIHLLRDTGPDWFAVRGAVCTGHDRHQVVREDRVRLLARLLSRDEGRRGKKNGTADERG
jgi:(5-formylfuran-3-yl)methyl phosphate synthase